MSLKKVALIFSVMILSLFSFSQIPEGYYSNAEGLQNDELKTAMYNIIKGHTEFPYVSTSTDVWDILKETDKDPNNSDNIILLYTGWSVNAAQEYNSGNGWTKEHVWSKIHGDFGTANGPGTDVHHLRPADGGVNSAKNSRWFDNCSEPYITSLNDSTDVFSGCYKSTTEWTWQPRDEVKGDIARMIFYMAVRYEGENGEPDLEIVDFIPDTNNTTQPIYAKISTLLEWNLEDPVSDWEINRNNIIYYNYQHNRNPFIDNPEWAESIWRSQIVNEETTNNTILKATNNDKNFKIYPNPTSGFITIECKNTQDRSIEIFDISGKVVKIISLENNFARVDFSNIAKGLYFVKNNEKFTKIFKL